MNKNINLFFFKSSDRNDYVRECGARGTESIEIDITKTLKTLHKAPHIYPNICMCRLIFNCVYRLTLLFEKDKGIIRFIGF